MKKNIGLIDRLLRVALGLALIAYGLSTGSWLGWLAILPLATAAVGWCGVYALLGINTCPRQKAH